MPPASVVAGTAVGGDLAGTLPNPTVAAARFASPGPIGSSTPSTVAGTTAVFSGVATSLNFKRGTGTPEGAVVGVIGDLFQRTDGGTDTAVYRKESGTGNTGWVAIAAGGGGGGDVYLANDNSFTARNQFNVEMASASRSAANAAILHRCPGSVTGKNLIAWSNSASNNGTGNILGGVEFNGASGRFIYASYDGFSFGVLPHTTNMWSTIVFSLNDGLIVSYTDHRFDTVIKVNDGVQVKEGSNKTSGVATLVGGTVTVSTNKVTANSRIQLTGQADGGTPGWLRVSARTPGTSFVITSSSPLDTGDVAWFLVEGY